MSKVKPLKKESFSNPRQSIFEDIKQEFKDDSVGFRERYGLVFLFKSYAENSNISGLPQVGRSKEIFRILFWLSIVIGGLGCLVWQIWVAVEKYQKNEASTKMVNSMRSSLDFPAITVCNQNPIDILRVQKYSPLLYSLIQAMKPPVSSNNSTSQISNNFTMPSTAYQQPNQNTPPGVNDFSGRQADSTFSNILDIQARIAEMPVNTKIKLSSDIQDLLISCTFNNYQCTASDFYPIYNYLYGNCFIFNVLNNKSSLQTMEIGPQYGLRLVLYINSSTYIPTTMAYGVRIVVGTPQEYPFPEDVGLNAGPGKLTSVGIKKMTSEALVPPEGDCYNYTAEEALRMSAFVNIIPNITYSRSGCVKTCFQKLVMQLCNCSHPNIPYDQNMAAYSNFSQFKMRQCNLLLQNDDYTCITTVKVSINNGTYNCANCKINCITTQYITYISQANWPTYFMQQTLMANLGSMDRMKDKTLTNVINDELLMVEIYYDTLNVLEIKDEDAMTIYMLISDIGGQMGLWLGLSMAAVFELVELMVDVMIGIIHSLIYVKQVKEKRKDEEAAAMEKTAKITADSMIKSSYDRI